MGGDLKSRVEEAIATMSEEDRKKLNESTQAETNPIKDITASLDGLPDDAPLVRVEEVLRGLAFSLKGFDSLRCAMVREAVVKKLERFGITSPARMVDAAIQGEQSGTPDQQQGRPVLFDDPELWPEAVDGATLLEDIVSTLKQFVVLPSHSPESVALWILHAHALEAFTISPLLVVTSPTKRSGKTLLLEVISCLTVRHIFASNITPATLFRCVDKYTPSLLIDEADTFLRDNDELRGILNAGHRKSSAYIMRTVGDEHEPVFFVTWCAKAIALIGKLPGTLEDRSIAIPIKRKGRGERVDRFNTDKGKLDLTPIKRKAMRWIFDNLDALRKADPETPTELNDRAADNWRPLLAISDRIGGHWPERARKAARELSGLVDEAENSAAIQLLTDLEKLFVECDTDKLPSEDICEALAIMQDRPWPEWRRGKPITQRQLAKLLTGFDVKPCTIRVGDKTPKGYTLEQFIDPFSRYLPPSIRNNETTVNKQELTPRSDPQREGCVSDGKTEVSTGNTKDVAGVADQEPLFPKEGEYEVKF